MTKWTNLNQQGEKRWSARLHPDSGAGLFPFTVVLKNNDITRYRTNEISKTRRYLIYYYLHIYRQSTSTIQSNIALRMLVSSTTRLQNPYHWQPIQATYFKLQRFSPATEHDLLDIRNLWPCWRGSWNTCRSLSSPRPSDPFMLETFSDGSLQLVPFIIRIPTAAPRPNRSR